jgi:hypothetical protein
MSKKAVFSAVLLLLASCNKDPPPKPAKEDPPKTTPVPSDMVFNDFLPSGAQTANLSVKVDGGFLEGGALAGGQGDAPPAAEDGGKLRVTDPGAEPRAVKKYAFVANKVDKRLLTLRQSAGGKEMSLAFTVDFTPKQVKPTGTHFDMKIVKVDLPDASGAEKAAAAQQFGMFNGLMGGFEVSPQGEISDLEFRADERMQSPQAARLAQVVIGSLEQFFMALLPPFPSTPIGVGAKWEANEERNEQGLKLTSARKFVLKDATNDSGTVTSEETTKLPKTNLPPRPGGPQGSVEIEAKGTHTYTFKLDHLATRMEGELTSKQSVDIKGQQPVSETSKSKQLVEVAK